MSSLITADILEALTRPGGVERPDDLWCTHPGDTPPRLPPLGHTCDQRSSGHMAGRAVGSADIGHDRLSMGMMGR